MRDSIERVTQSQFSQVKEDTKKPLFNQFPLLNFYDQQLQQRAKRMNKVGLESQPP